MVEGDVNAGVMVEGDVNAGVGYRGGVVAASACMCGSGVCLVHVTC